MKENESDAWKAGLVGLNFPESAPTPVGVEELVLKVSNVGFGFPLSEGVFSEPDENTFAPDF
jgi:hypothetical protein